MDIDPREVRFRMSLDLLETEAQAESRKWGGKLSLMACGIWFVSGVFVSKCLLEMSHKAEKMTDLKQGVLLTLGGIAGAAAVGINGYRKTGIHPFQLLQERKLRGEAGVLRDQFYQFSSWAEGPDEGRVDEAIVEDFRTKLNELG